MGVDFQTVRDSGAGYTAGREQTPSLAKEESKDYAMVSTYFLMQVESLAIGEVEV